VSTAAVAAEPGRWRTAWHLMTRNPLFVVGLVIFVVVVVCALFAPWLAPYEPNAINFADKLVPPGWVHPFGTDDLGRDILSRVIHGARTSLIIGITVLAIALIVGIPIGLLAGYYGGRLDTLLMRVTDVFLAFPKLVLALAFGDLTRALGTGDYLAQVMGEGFAPAVALPLAFLAAAAMAFAIGSSWGTFAIMIPIAVTLALSLELNPAPFLAAVLSGGIFGDHASPISDTTVVASMAAATDHIDHVKTQLPYALIGAVVALAGYGLTGLFYL